MELSTRYAYELRTGMSAALITVTMFCVHTIQIVSSTKTQSDPCTFYVFIWVNGILTHMEINWKASLPWLLNIQTTMYKFMFSVAIASHSLLWVHPTL